ncbi:uncharacterized protein MAM_02944 [Metarhizium album ARSEF 1941]|uniref:Uncharacterized protein n=1 Tax=Metarhizium album (strain ARSEF 1941) TaxID=1081103 RepID=A0A0B2WT86_METAS|nr:uncharacterized protein MAM_02944 [Metarhizium album ARSEF 1941]KHN99246.1 hypothetical protein MAM_02944 [Metarhizium album ARSEF 1941]
MLSHLRFHRRGTSNPTSPISDQQHSLSPLSNAESPLALVSASPLDGMPALASSSSAPTLPPITRVTSSDLDSRHERDERQNGPGGLPENRPRQSPRSFHSGGVGGFIGGKALQNYRRDVEAQQKASRTDPSDRTAGGNSLVRPEDPSARIRPSHFEPTIHVARSSQFMQVASFSTPTELQASNAPNLGRRPAGSKLPQEASSSLSNPPSSAAAEPQKGKKGLPFLRNPMSTLLMRRRNNQNAPDLRPLPLSTKDEEPSYDPRIRGTRVHDFSAPRKPRDVYRGNPASSRSVSDIRLASATENRPTALKVPGEPSIQARRSAPQAAKTSSRSESSIDANNLSTGQSQSRTTVADEPTAPAADEAPVVTSQELYIDGHAALPTSTSEAGGVLEGAEMIPKASSSTRTTRSRNISLSEMSMSAVPRHMKSTSSRFSFDMIGAAKQEKLLEERHRQRELERRTNGNDGFRDSRSDDFDEDAFDYDAMMDDDGFEERIPGVNADFDEQVPDLHDLDVQLDPDNDQENFAGFDFQRSNPTSSLASPHSGGMLMTPRDADGNVIGFAMTKDTPGSSTHPLSSPLPASIADALSEHRLSGLGIQDASTPLASDNDQNTKEDDLYFDDGIIAFENEFAEDLAALPDVSDEPFDESIFDNNDTDQFGRPVPGAFQQAQSLRRAGQQSSTKRESVMTSRLSAHSAVSCSTAHTSLSVDGQAEQETGDSHAKKPDTESESKASQAASDSAKSVAAYQAALAAAAHRAAASGKFLRSSSPASIPVLGDDESTSEIPQDDIHGGYDDEEDDLDFDDDAIIAEANASALANDSDGWYGQEFGFYSAPPGFHITAHNGRSSAHLKEYEYANGGFFGPDGIGAVKRSTSGRMISREPNLTPITERSEYSNRNSFMSLGYAPLSTSTPIVQSPGLAQLAMMADCGDDQMTLSALLRLRSRAWGGSQASLASSREDSPRSDRGDLSSSPWMSTSCGQASQVNHAHAGMPSTFSTAGYDSDAASASGSPTMTMANVNSGHLPRAAIPEEDANEILVSGHPIHEALTGQRSRIDVNNQAGEYIMNKFTQSPVKGHRHKGSADSISYVKEEDSGETHWVLERRRTGETGEVEVLEREVIEGRQI